MDQINPAGGSPSNSRFEALSARLNPNKLQGQELRKFMRRRLFMILGIVVAAIALIWLLWWVFFGSHYVSTDNAYVDAAVAQVTTQVEGTVLKTPVVETQRVKQGDVLVVLDPADMTLSLAQAEANYAQAIHRVEQNFANANVATAQVAARRADLKRAELDYKRRSALSSTGAVSGDELSTAKNAFDTAKANLDAAEQQFASLEALIKGSDVDHNPEVLAAKSLRDRARLDLDRTIIRAPTDGIVAQNQVQVGRHVPVGALLMSVVPIGNVYVNANFKEGQLEDVKEGQPVKLTSDLYGSGVVFHGRVVGLGGGTGSAFALIPTQNATGNWIKVVQRLPVRIALDPKELTEHPLRVGLSMDVTIDISK